jgi:hypothetical protein
MAGFMLQLRDDVPTNDAGKPTLDTGAYRPIPYSGGRICERCWLHVDHMWRELVGPGAGWSLHERWSLRTVGSDGCPHGGES